MVKLLQQIGEYFLGTKTRKFYTDYRSFLREYVTEPDYLKRMIKSSKIEEKAELILGKLVPNLIDAVTVGYSLITKNPPYTLIAGEGLRLACMSVSGKRNKKLIMKILKISGNVQVKGSDICEKLDRLREYLDKDGEDWRNPDEK